MTETALTIPFSADSGVDTQTTERKFVHLEQIDPPESSETVTMYDIQQMVTRARTGMPARTYKPHYCPASIVDQTVLAEFDFYSWPSKVDLPHAIFSSLGEVSRPIIVEKEVHFSATFELSDVIELDFILLKIRSATWETACYDADGKVVHDIGDPWTDGLSTIRVSKPVFGVVRIVGVKKGAKHRLNVRLSKSVPVPHSGEFPTEAEFEESGASEHFTYQEWLDRYYGFTDVVSWQNQHGDSEAVGQEPTNLTGLSISNLQATVTAKWMDGDEEQSEQLRMKIPQCLQDLLTACGTDADGDGIPDYWGTNPEKIIRVCFRRKEKNPLQVYVSSCTCKVLKTMERKDDKNSWCG